MLRAGTHFRYGTISWIPRRCDAAINTDPRLNPDQESSADNCSPIAAGGVFVEFTVKLAFRRDYTWGEFFGERWTDQGNNPNPTYFDKDGAQNFQTFNSGFSYDAAFAAGNWKIKFPPGYSSNYQPIPLAAMAAHKVFGDSYTEGVFAESGRICDNPYDSGIRPECIGSNTTADMPTDPRTGNYIPYFPYLVGGGLVGLGASCPCSPAQLADNYNTCPPAGGECDVLCDTVTRDPSFLGGSEYCGPWAYTYGFFTGVTPGNGVSGDPDYSKTLEITLTGIDTDVYSSIGNYITGEGRIQHQYPSVRGPGDEPWVAFFTGGDRIGRLKSGLQNNYGGRHRLEISVNLDCHEAGKCWQKSPRATSLPVVPIPYTERNGASLYDFSFSTFRIAAYDPDIGDDVYFFHANNAKYGALVGHGIPEGDYPNNPTPLEYTLARDEVIRQRCNSDCTRCPPNMVYEGPGGTVQVIEDFCRDYPVWNVSTVGFHTAGPPPRLMVDAFTGVVHWQTGKSPIEDDVIDRFPGGTGTTRFTGGYQLPSGWETSTTGTPYRWAEPNGAVYDGWVYDRKSFTYMKYSNYSDCETSSGPYDGDSCTTESLPPGFYNLVLDIRAQSGDRCLGRDAAETPTTEQCMSLEDIMLAEAGASPEGYEVNMHDPIAGPFTPQANQPFLASSKRGYTTIPLDFLIYLYPAMSMCHNCNGSAVSAGRYVGQGIPTYKDGTGTYGFDVTQQLSIVPPNVDKYVHATFNFEGTGRCIICGGADTNLTARPEAVDQDPTVCQSCLVPAISTCHKNQRPFWINKDYSINDDPYTPAPPGWSHTDTYPTGDPTIVGKPAWGELNTAQISAFKGSIVEFDLVAADEDECVELWIYDTGLYKGDELSYCTTGSDNADACAILNTLKSDFDPNLDAFDMWLSDHKPAYLADSTQLNGKPDVLLSPGKSVRRTFKWPARNTWPSQLEADNDPRPVDSSVCFFAFDGYLFSDFRCIRITLNTQQQIYWSDRRPGLDAALPYNVVQDKLGYSTGTFTDTQDGVTVTLTAPLTMANRTRMVVNVGDKVTFDMQVKQASGYDPLDIFISQGVMPEGATMVNDTNNNNDPIMYTFSWTPTKGQECEYEICFLATNIRGSEYPMTVGYSDLTSRLGPMAPSIYSYTPTTTSTSATAPYIDERCYTIEVTDMAAHLKGGAFIDVDAADSLVSTLDAGCGYSFGGWFFPEESTTEMIPLVSIGYTTGAAPAAVSAVHQLRWVDVTPDMVAVTGGVGSVSTSQEYRSLALYEDDDGSGLVAVAQTAAVACDGGWHYFFVTVDSDMKVAIYLDGVELGMVSPDMHEFTVPPTAMGTASVFPASFTIPGGAAPAFRLGADAAGNNFDGWFNDIRVYSRALTSDEVEAQMFATCSNLASGADCLALSDADKAAAAKVGLELWLNFNNADNDNSAGAADPSNANVVHGCTGDALPADAQFSRYLSCADDRDKRDQSNWGGSFEYCNDYTSLIGARTLYFPDFYAPETRGNITGICGVGQCMVKQGPPCAVTGCTAADFASLNPDILCSYQCADIDNSFHGSGFNSSNPVTGLQTDANIHPYVSAEATLGAWEVVGDLTEMDTPYTPYFGEMTMLNVGITDKSGKGRSASAVLNTGTATFEYKISPVFDACPAMPVPNVVHVDGNQEILLKGSNFAEGKFLRCHFSGMGSSPATVVEYDNRGGMMVPSAIKCTAPAGFGAATASALEVSNDGGSSFTDFNIPVYFTESAAYFDGSEHLEISPIGTSWLDDGISVGTWFNLHEPLATRSNGLAMDSPVLLMALEWPSAVSSLDDHLVVTYNSMSAVNTIQVYATTADTPTEPILTVQGDLEIGQGTTGWHYVMITMNGGELTLYLDGAEAGKVDTTAPGGDASLWIGGRVADVASVAGTSLGSYSEFVGYMDRLSLFTKVVSQCEMKQWMWGNLTRDFTCPSGEPSDGVSKPLYQPRPSGLLAHFGFDGLTYSHGSRLTTTPEVQTWDTDKMRYIMTDTAETWVGEVTDDVLINGAANSGVVGANSVVYGAVLQVGFNASTMPSLKFVTVPFLPPSFNAPRRKICGSVFMATSSRDQAVSTGGASLSDTGKFMFADINFLDNTSGGYTGSVYSLGEPAPVPNRCEENHQFLVDSQVPVEGYMLPEPWIPSLSQCTETGATVYGFGFAKSPWLKCMQGDAGGDLSSTSTHYISSAEVRCTAEGTATPYKYKFGVANNYLEEDEACEAAPMTTPVETPEMLQTKDMSLYFDGDSTFVMANGVSDEVNSTGVTFGAWFFPTRSTADPQQEPVVAFTTECGSVLPLNNGNAPPTAIVVGAMYTEGRVCLVSDLPYYAKQSIPAHGHLDLPNKWDITTTSYGLLDTQNGTDLCIDAAADQWHYVEIAVNPKLLIEDIPSDEPKASYIATMTVDGETIGDQEDGDLRIPALPVENGLFFAGGITCPTVTATSDATNPNEWHGQAELTAIADYESRFFQGMIDEIRVYKGVKADVDWATKAMPTEDMVAYYTFAITRGDNQRRQTPHCEEFGTGPYPADCIQGGAYFARNVEQYWVDQPAGLRESEDTLATFPRPTGYYPVARGSPLRPFVYPTLVTHTDPIGVVGVDICDTPTVSDASYSGTSLSHQNLQNDTTSFPINFSTETKHPYVQSGPSRYNHFIPSENTVYNFAFTGDISGATKDALIYQQMAPMTNPDYRYMEVPWLAATLESISEDVSALDGGREVSVTGYNVAPSNYLNCKFLGLKYENKSFSLDEDFAYRQDVMAYGGFDASVPDTIRCPFPGTSVAGDASTLGSNWLKVPSLVSLQLENPAAKESEMVMFKEMALNFGGNVIGESSVTYGSADNDGSVRLTCPDGLRMDNVVFGSYGRPQKRCNKQTMAQCDGTTTEVDCNWQAWKTTKTCDSDAKAKPGHTASIIMQRCFGKKECTVPAKDHVFGDPCPGRTKWLSVTVECSDRWMSKDYAKLSLTDALTLGSLLNPVANEPGEYSFSAWVKPGMMEGQQAVASFGCMDCPKMNRAVLQWVGMADNMGMFHYYDDYINDVVMKRDDGSNIMLAANQWYHVAFTVDKENCGFLYLNGNQVASFTTASRPVGGGFNTNRATFTLGVDLDDQLHPKEFFQGMIDEVRVFKKALSKEEVFSTIYWTMDMGSELFNELVAYYKFNNMAEEDAARAYDETSNDLYLLLATSAVDVWDPEQLEYDVTSSTAENHMKLVAHGAAWFPATTYALDAEFSTAPLGAGLASFDILGVNFVKGMSRVYYGGEDVTASVVEITDTKIDMLLPDGSCDGGESSIYVTNVPEGSVLSVPEETITQAADVPDLQNGLICYFPFFGGASDWSGNDYHAEIVDGADLTEDRNGFADRAYSFDGDDVIKVPDCVPAPLTGKSITTVAMWVKYADIQFPEFCSSYLHFEEEIGFEGCMMQDHAIMTHAWKLIVGVAEASGTKIYVNGQELISGSGKLPEYLDIVHRVMLLQEIGGGDFVGTVDDVWIYDRALCDAEVMKLYTTQMYAVELDGNSGLTSSIMSSASFGSPGVSVKLITSTAATGPADNSVLTQLIVDLSGNSDIVNHDGSGVLEDTLTAFPGVTIPTATATDAYSMVVEANVYAPFSSTYTFSVTTSDEVYCWLKNDLDQILYTITSSQRNTIRTHERQASLMAGNWYSYYCAYTKLTDDSAAGDITPRGLLGLRWRSADGQINGPLSGPYVRSAGASELVVSAWVHPYETEGRVGILSLKGDSMEADEMARFGLSIVDGALNAAFYIGDDGDRCDSDYYREIRSWNSEIVKDQWQHVAVAYDGKTMTFFVDGRMTEQKEYSSYAYINVAGDVELMIGADAASDMFEGQVYSVAMYNKVPDNMDMWVKDLWECPISEPEDNLIFNLLLNEGVGEDAKDFSVNLDQPTLRTFGDAKLSAAAKWVDATCSSLGADKETTEYAGQALVEGLAGQCMVFSIQGRDTCGSMRISGGDNYTVEVVGPLHLHSEIYELTVGDGIEDMNDGSYLVHFTREISGYYLIYVKLNGEIVKNAAGVDATKTYVHPYVTNAMNTYMYDEEDMLGLDELRESCAGIPVAYMIQTVDAYQNLRTLACDTDAFEVKFDGPYEMDGAVTNLEDGRFRVNYNAEVAGPYQMRVTASVAADDGTEEKPVAHYGGRTCAGWGKSELDYCTLYDSPDVTLAGDDSPICIQVHECGSLRTFKDSIYASFPDTDDLDLEGPFTMSAWVMPVPEDMMASKQYILSKQSEYSGKGYWLALIPDGTGTSYSLELGIYIGSENYRTVRHLPMIMGGAWTRVGATYDGITAQLYINGTLAKEAKWADEDPMFERRNAQPLRVGKAFSGMIDNVMLFEKAVPEKLMDMDVAMCPSVSIGESKHDDLIAYYRFNEGATRNMDGELVAQNNAWATKDSSGKGNDGFVGLFSDETGQNKEMTIRCPTGSVISEVLFANYGSSKGGYGTYEVDECGATNSMSYIEERCLGLQTCKVMAAYSVFGNPCKHAAKTLAVNAICAMPTPDPDRASWAIGSPAPHWVGTTAPVMPECPYEMDNLPELFDGILPERSCDDWDITKATAGQTEYFMLRMKDMCGYKNRYPQTVDGYITTVDTSMMMLGGATPYEPVFADSSSAVLSYPIEFVAPEIEQCGIDVSAESDSMAVNFTWGGQDGGFDMYCSRYRDLYIGQYTPTFAHEEASLALSLEVVAGAVYETIQVNVMPAAISAEASTTCAATETAPECESGCMDIMAEAGVEAMFEFCGQG